MSTPTLPAHKYLPARPVSTERHLNGEIIQYAEPGLTQYAEVAARLHAALLVEDFQLMHTAPNDTAKEAFDHADAFFAELAKRTTS